MDKAPESEWAGLLGIQYQMSKRWQLRGECNFIGKDRVSVLASVNYRFMGFKKKKNSKSTSQN
jgi:predicted site-specific integrase-resolvase